MYDKLLQPHRFGTQDEKSVKALLLQELRKEGWNPLIANATRDISIQLKSKKSKEFDAHIGTFLLIVNIKEKSRIDFPITAILTLFQLLLRFKENNSNQEWMDIQIYFYNDLPNSTLQFEAFSSYYERELKLYKDLYIIDMTGIGIGAWNATMNKEHGSDPYLDLLIHTAIQHKIQIQFHTPKLIERSFFKRLGSILSKPTHRYIKISTAKNQKDLEKGESQTMALQFSLFLYDLLLLLDKRISEKMETAE